MKLVKATAVAMVGLFSVVAATQDVHAFPGPDVIVGNLQSAISWGSAGGINAYNTGTDACNIGDTPAQWIDGTPFHPVISQSIYRYSVVNGASRFEQLGINWCKWSFCALQGTTCSACSPYCGGCCNHLGVGCSDPYTATRNGSWVYLGPRSYINAATASFPAFHPTPSGSVVAGRIQVLQSDINPSLNPGALYYAEAHYLSPDDSAAGNDNNNASWRRVTFGTDSPTHTMTVTGTTTRMQQAIFAWAVNDPQVSIVHIDVPGDGRMSLAYRVTPIAGGMYHYEYLLHNMNSHRSASTFTVTVPDPCTSVTNIGFHDIFYHDGDGYVLGTNYDGTDWPGVLAGGNLTWAMVGGTTEGANPNGNAIRFGTAYNFRFDSSAAPTTGQVTIGLYRSGSPSSMVATTLVPSGTAVSCTRGDVNNDGIVDSRDLGRFADIVVNGGATAQERCASDLETVPDCAVGYDDVQGMVDCVLSLGCH